MKSHRMIFAPNVQLERKYIMQIMAILEKKLKMIVFHAPQASGKIKRGKSCVRTVSVENIIAKDPRRKSILVETARKDGLPRLKEDLTAKSATSGNIKTSQAKSRAKTAQWADL